MEKSAFHTCFTRYKTLLILFQFNKQLNDIQQARIDNVFWNPSYECSNLQLASLEGGGIPVTVASHSSNKPFQSLKTEDIPRVRSGKKRLTARGYLVNKSTVAINDNQLLNVACRRSQFLSYTMCKKLENVNAAEPRHESQNKQTKNALYSWAYRVQFGTQCRSCPATSGKAACSAL